MRSIQQSETTTDGSSSESEKHECGWRANELGNPEETRGVCSRGVDGSDSAGPPQSRLAVLIADTTMRTSPSTRQSGSPVVTDVFVTAQQIESASKALRTSPGSS